MHLWLRIIFPLNYLYIYCCDIVDNNQKILYNHIWDQAEIIVKEFLDYINWRFIKDQVNFIKGLNWLVQTRYL